MGLVDRWSGERFTSKPPAAIPLHAGRDGGCCETLQQNVSLLDLDFFHKF
jgi:hypothetical protein